MVFILSIWLWRWRRRLCIIWWRNVLLRMASRKRMWKARDYVISAMLVSLRMNFYLYFYLVCFILYVVMESPLPLQAYFAEWPCCSYRIIQRVWTNSLWKADRWYSWITHWCDALHYRKGNSHSYNSITSRSIFKTVFNSSSPFMTWRTRESFPSNPSLISFQ